MATVSPPRAKTPSPLVWAIPGASLLLPWRCPSPVQSIFIKGARVLLLKQKKDHVIPLLRQVQASYLTQKKPVLTVTYEALLGGSPPVFLLSFFHSALLHLCHFSISQNTSTCAVPSAWNSLPPESHSLGLDCTNHPVFTQTPHSKRGGRWPLYLKFNLHPFP